MALKELTPHEKLYEKAALLGFPETIEGYNIIYEHKWQMADLDTPEGHLLDTGNCEKYGPIQYGPTATKVLILKAIADKMTALEQPTLYDLMEG